MKLIKILTRLYWTSTKKKIPYVSCMAWYSIIANFASARANQLGLISKIRKPAIKNVNYGITGIIATAASF